MTFPDPRSPEFWAREGDELRDALEDIVILMLGRAGANGRSLLPTGLRVLVNWNVFNQAALDFVRQFGLTTLRDINATTRGAVVQLIGDWIQSGEPIGKLQDRMAALPVFSTNRANQIAVTEVTRIYAEGNIMVWRSTGLVDQKRWQTANDERVCPICAPLHNVVVSLDGGFTPSGEGLGPTAPPAHPNCRCWLQPIASLEGLDQQLDQILAQA